MRVFVDTNVILDVLSKRLPFYDAAARIWTLSETGRLDSFVSAISFNNSYYILRKYGDSVRAMQAMQSLRDIFKVVALDLQILNQSIDSTFADFEDAIQLHSAIRAEADFLITRDPSHFPKDVIPVVTPEELIAALGEG